MEWEAWHQPKPETIGRFERLFADLESELLSADETELRFEVADRSRAEFGQLQLVDRLRGSVGQRIGILTEGAERVLGQVRDVGADWVLLADETPTGVARRERLLPLHAIISVEYLSAQSAAPGSEGRVGKKRVLRLALRRLGRDRATLRVHLRDGQLLEGTIDRVGVDFCELAEHAAGEARRARAVRRVSAVPFAAIVMVHSLV